MLVGAQILRRPPEGWKPQGWAPAAGSNKMITDRSVDRNRAVGTVQFYLLWSILFINVAAGIGILSQASPMTQDMFGKTAVQAAAVVSLISLFNLAGRFSWASLSGYIRSAQHVFCMFFPLVQPILFFTTIPRMATMGAYTLFLASWSIIYTMYGGGFATIPAAFLADIFGLTSMLEHNSIG